MPRSLIAGNWKMHTTVCEAVVLSKSIAAARAGYTDRDVMIAPPFTALAAIHAVLGETGVILAGQNVGWEDQGAFTGEISPPMLKDVGCSMAIVGHSERRHIFGEDDVMINKRIHGALRHGLVPVFCIGETLEERETGKTMAVLERQLRGGLEEVCLLSPESLVVAYEPVWAIGTGRTASLEQARQAHRFVRDTLGEIFEKTVASEIRILYGGSVNPENIDHLMAEPDVNGALVGGASLKADLFARIIQYC